MTSFLLVRDEVIDAILPRKTSKLQVITTRTPTQTLRLSRGESLGNFVFDHHELWKLFFQVIQIYNILIGSILITK